MDTIKNIKRVKTVIVEGRKFYNIPVEAKVVYEDMNGNYCFLDKHPPSMYEYPACSIFPVKRIWKRFICDC